MAPKQKIIIDTDPGMEPTSLFPLSSNKLKVSMTSWLCFWL